MTKVDCSLVIDKYPGASDTVWCRGRGGDWYRGQWQGDMGGVEMHRE